MTSPVQVSVVTPSLNPRPDYLARVFEALRRQTLPLDQWEYVVVDSGSDEPLKNRLDLSWHPRGRVVEAPYKALVRSRLLGMQETAGGLLVFVDDDNVLSPTYLADALALMTEYPFIGAAGAYCEGELEIPFEPWMKEFLAILCAMQYCEERKVPLQYAMAPQGGPWVPPGAGLVIRREVARAYQQRVADHPEILGLGRIGQALLGSEDTDLVYTAVDAGYAMATTTRLTLTHLIPARRLTLAYLRRLLYASNYATARLLIQRGWKKPQPAPVLTWWQRRRKQLGRLRTRSPEAQCWEAFSQGYRDGLTGSPFDSRYS